jgi:choline kinase
VRQKAAPPLSRALAGAASCMIGPMLGCRQAVIVAAGRGSRLAPLTAQRPKCLVEVGGAPLVDTLVARMSEIGVRHVVVVAGYRSDAVRAHLTGRRDLRIDVVDNPAWAAAQNALSLHAAAEHVRPPFVLLDGDLWLSPALAAALHVPDRMAVARLSPGMIGTRAHAEAGQVVALGARGGLKTVNAASFSAAWWQDWFRPALERLVAAGRTGEYYEAAIADALRAGAPPLGAVVAGDGDWFEIDTPADLIEAERSLAAARAA